MDQSTRTGERLTAILSILAAVAILAAGVAAQQSRSARPDELTFLESDLRFQLEAAYRLNPKKGESRLEQLESVLAAWRESPQTETDRRLLSTWLLEATIRSMPGALEQLPPSPQFGQQPPPESLSMQVPEPVPPERRSIRRGDILELETEDESPARVPGLTPDLAPPADEHTSVSATEPPSRPEPKPATPAVQLNLRELDARLAGYHQGLSELESTLQTDDRPDVARLAAQIRLLGNLAEDFQFVELYYTALSAAERRAVAEPRSLGPTIAALREQLDRLQRDAEGDFLSEYDTALGQQIAELRGQLEAIAARAEW